MLSETITVSGDADQWRIEEVEEVPLLSPALRERGYDGNYYRISKPYEHGLAQISLAVRRKDSGEFVFAV